MLHLDLINDIKSLSKEIKANNKVDWDNLSLNPAAIHLLERNQCMIDWYNLDLNSSARHLMEENLDKIDDWARFVGDDDPTCYNLWKKRVKEIQQSPFFDQDSLNWEILSINPSAIHLLEENY